MFIPVRGFSQCHNPAYLDECNQCLDWCAGSGEQPLGQQHGHGRQIRWKIAGKRMFIPAKQGIISLDVSPFDGITVLKCKWSFLHVRIKTWWGGDPYLYPAKFKHRVTSFGLATFKTRSISKAPACKTWKLHLGFFDTFQDQGLECWGPNSRRSPVQKWINDDMWVILATKIHHMMGQCLLKNDRSRCTATLCQSEYVM